MFRKYSPPAAEPWPRVPFSIAFSRAPSQPGFTRALTRYRMQPLFLFLNLFSYSSRFHVRPARFIASALPNFQKWVGLAFFADGGGRSVAGKNGGVVWK